ncbi:MAG: hypothetical protein A3F31_01090 [Candidatus Levybacteria bacterium RIFCSPHIGHO2_12_FULL_38_12]|nr:MAG: hypothetical protein A2770_01840 [Candidatus Levybacteria bacterium RIFCSPHIGHO2_01_FULL_38_12]OGH22038.1 MAG: hypothetical protein A3D75_03370 [Candidatus Levybacteria bacterium RIFCSPHIGHO2_02_FULL_37_18]OGH23244.1 MAG: hypothetical protein A3F31_01090 [Candidatus Levybacteria bacterium RIFCSPHIGHO2_12_FULL_38_12]OGH33731.1 MAG: hypothetical protein A3A47_02805 [Candidatus Levybacteria bacterium RIFCSPLOWO2_01_FULL_37_20]OGH44637.1 MAG: hypothetical protein A3J14_00890 [Candidatus Lev
MRKQILIVLIVFFIVVIARAAIELVKFSPILYGIFFKKEIEVKTTKNNTLNVLLLGTGGGRHEGPDLTDTVMFASLDLNMSKLTLVSIPRDLWMPDLNARINTAYTTGESKKKGSGLILTKAVVSKLVNQPINYGIRINFDGFVKAIDFIGGLDIPVDNTLDDYEYPIAGKEDDLCGHSKEELVTLATASSQLEAFPCRYTHIHFEKGKIHMKGSQALEFVRSRHALGTEGSDFARSIRQQKVIKAFKDKVLSPQTFLNPVKIAQLNETLTKSIDTDIDQSEFDDFIKLSQKFKDVAIHSFVIDAADEKKPGLLVNPPLTDFNGAWVLIPRKGNGNFSEIQQYIKCVLVSDMCTVK